MNYSENPSDVRVDIFTLYGKWYETVSIRWLKWNGETLIHDAFRIALENDKHTSKMLSSGYWIFVCLEPYHEHSHPITLGLDFLA